MAHVAVSWTAVEKANIWTCLLQKYGVSKAAAWPMVTALEADTVNLLLLPNPATWQEVWQCADACFRKNKGQSPIVRSLVDILGDLLGTLLGAEAENDG